MKNNDENNPIEVFSGSILEAEMVRSLLENAEIDAFLRDENIGVLAPWYTASGGVGAVKVVVSNLDYSSAKDIVEEYERNLNDSI